MTSTATRPAAATCEFVDVYDVPAGEASTVEFQACKDAATVTVWHPGDAADDTMVVCAFHAPAADEGLVVTPLA